MIFLRILVETSARHIHLCKEDLYKLFGKDYTLNKRKDLSQPGQFASEEKITIRGSKSEINNVSVLGPLREKTQVEISLTDCRKLGIEPILKESGDLQGSSGCILIGPKGEVKLKEGVIVPKRHIHLDPKSSEIFNLSDGKAVKVKIDTNDRSLIFDDVIVRVSSKFLPAMHIDTDESNAAGITGEVFGEVLI